jgi:deoxyribodipyrimidine photo-lyase
VNEILIQNNDKQKVFFWFRRDLRLEDNIGLFHALESEYPVIPLFIYDDAILDSLPKMMIRVGFIHESLLNINDQLKQIGSSLLVKRRDRSVFKALSQEFQMFFLKDYEQYAIARDHKICEFWRVKHSVFFL